MERSRPRVSRLVRRPRVKIPMLVPRLLKGSKGSNLERGSDGQQSVTSIRYLMTRVVVFEHVNSSFLFTSHPSILCITWFRFLLCFQHCLISFHRLQQFFSLHARKLRNSLHTFRVRRFHPRFPQRTISFIFALNYRIRPIISNSSQPWVVNSRTRRWLLRAPPIQISSTATHRRRLLPPVCQQHTIKVGAFDFSLR